MALAQKLERAFNPRTVAVVGDKKASDYLWLRNLKDFQGKVYSVQIDPNELPGIAELGVPNYTSLLDIPDAIDYVIVAVPREVAPRILADCIKKGVGGVTLFTSGFAETGTEKGRQLQETITQMARDAGLALIGPNCMGLFNPRLGLRNGGPDQYVGESGPVGFIAQSGTQAVGFTMAGHREGVLVNKAVSYGNGVILDSTDYLEYFAQDKEIKIIGLYLEGVRDGQRFFQLLRAITREKPVVIWKGGQTSGGARAIASHTGSLAVEGAVWGALLKQSGAIAARNLEETVDLVKALLHLPVITARRVGLISISGGQSVAVADAFSQAGLEVPTLSDASYQELDSFFNIVGGSYRNPIDLGQNIPTPENLTTMLSVLDRDEKVDTMVVELSAGWGRRRELLEGQIETLLAFKEHSSKPLLAVVSMALGRTDSATLQQVGQRLATGNIPTYPSFERCANALSKVIAYHQFCNQWGASTPSLNKR